MNNNPYRKIHNALLVYTSKIHMNIHKIIKNPDLHKIQEITKLLWKHPIPPQISKYQELSDLVCYDLQVRHIDLLTDDVCVRSRLSIWNPHCELVEDIHPYEHCFFISLHPGLYQRVQEYEEDIITHVSRNTFEYVGVPPGKYSLTNRKNTPVVSYHIYVNDSACEAGPFSTPNDVKLGSSEYLEHHSDPDLAWYGMRA